MKRRKRVPKTFRGWVLRFKDEYAREFDDKAPFFYMSKKECEDWGPDWKRIRATLNVQG